MGLISDADYSWVNMLFEKKSIFDLFSIRIFPVNSNSRKASMKPFTMLVKQAESLGIKASQILNVGDSSIDMCAKKFGIKTVLYNPSCEDINYFQILPDFEITSLEKLEEILKF